ncbi:hypothetical protein UlMin_024549 [Ulmus minor]
MASLLPIILLLVFSCSYLSCSSEIIRKELRTKEINQDIVLQLSHSVHPNRIDPSRVVQFSWQPRVFLYKGFLSEEECDRLISLAQKTNENFTRDGDGSRDTIMRGWLASLEDDIVSRIEERISAWTFLPKENGKALQVFHYVNEKTSKNLDYFGSSSSMEPRKPLIATVVLYLSNVTAGGQILFSKSEDKEKIWSDCSKTNDILRPIKGNAILFFNLHPNTTPDSSSSHVRCPVLEEEMWLATKFFHVKAIAGEKLSLESEDKDCADMDESCPRWAAIGECERNPVFMVGSRDYYGTCRKSCSVC